MPRSGSGEIRQGSKWSQSRYVNEQVTKVSNWGTDPSRNLGRLCRMYFKGMWKKWGSLGICHLTFIFHWLNSFWDSSNWYSSLPCMGLSHEKKTFRKKDAGTYSRNLSLRTVNAKAMRLGHSNNLWISVVLKEQNIFLTNTACTSQVGITVYSMTSLL